MGYPTLQVSEIDERGSWGQLQNKLQIMRDPRSLSEQFSEALLHHHNQVTLATKQENLPVRMIGYSPLFEETRVYPGAQTDFALMPLHQDPAVRSGQPIWVPPHALNDLRRIRRAGLNFQAIYIAHELPKGRLLPGKPVTLDMVAPRTPRGLAIKASELSDLSWKPWQMLGGAIRGMTTGSMSMLSVMTAPALAVGYDPIVFGLYYDPKTLVRGKPMATWYYLTHWIDGED